MKMIEAQQRNSAPHRGSVVEKPFTAAELRAKRSGEICLELARSYEAQGDTVRAELCCQTGLELTTGIARPLMIRDQLHDFLAKLNQPPTLRTR